MRVLGVHVFSEGINHKINTHQSAICKTFHSQAHLPAHENMAFQLECRHSISGPVCIVLDELVCGAQVHRSFPFQQSSLDF